jgi:hypothetical protein
MMPHWWDLCTAAKVKFGHESEILNMEELPETEARKWFQLLDSQVWCVLSNFKIWHKIKVNSKSNNTTT